MKMLKVNEALPTGCRVEGHWGQYGMAHMLDQFDGEAYVLDSHERALVDAHLASMGPSLSEFDDDSYDRIVELADEAEAIINLAIAGYGQFVEWDDGELFICYERNQDAF